MPYEPDAEAVAAIARHMNDDHPDDCVVLARAYGGVDSVTGARVVGVDSLGMDLAAEGPQGGLTVRVPWSEPLADRPAVRREVVKAYDWAQAQLGG
jgi:putative heme iron utilization protein